MSDDYEMEDKENDDDRVLEDPDRDQLDDEIKQQDDLRAEINNINPAEEEINLSLTDEEDHEKETPPPDDHKKRKLKMDNISRRVTYTPIAKKKTGDHKPPTSFRRVIADRTIKVDNRSLDEITIEQSELKAINMKTAELWDKITEFRTSGSNNSLEITNINHETGELVAKIMMRNQRYQTEHQRAENQIALARVSDLLSACTDAARSVAQRNQTRNHQAHERVKNRRPLITNKPRFPQKSENHHHVAKMLDDLQIKRQPTTSRKTDHYPRQHNKKSSPKEDLLCDFCFNDDHSPEDCTEYRTADDRRRAIGRGACVCCLRHHEDDEECRNQRKCTHCRQGKHHEAVCRRKYPAQVQYFS